MLVHEVEQAGDTFVMAVGEESVGGQGGGAAQELVGKDSTCARNRLPPPSNMSEKLTASRAPPGQNAAGSVGRLVVACAGRVARADAPAIAANAPRVSRRLRWVD